MVSVKICGVTRGLDAQAAIEAGADAIGLNFVRTSPRFLEQPAAERIASAVDGRVELWGVFVDEDPCRVRRRALAVRLSRVQLHGDEPPEEVQALADLSVVKGIRVRGPESLERMARYSPWGFLLDTWSQEAPGGTGRTFDWKLARGASVRARLVLAGGLKPENVRAAVRAVRPDWVDTASGVESSPGIKDHDRMRRFIEEARRGSADE